MCEARFLEKEGKGVEGSLPAESRGAFPAARTVDGECAGREEFSGAELVLPDPSQDGRKGERGRYQQRRRCTSRGNEKTIDRGSRRRSLSRLYYCKSTGKSHRDSKTTSSGAILD